MRAPVITISRIEATWVEIEWSATNGVEQYRVTYERVIGAQQRGHCPQQHDSAVLDFSSTTTHATLSELEEYSSYYVTVIAKRGEESFVSSQQISFMTRSAGTKNLYMYHMHFGRTVFRSLTSQWCFSLCCACVWKVGGEKGINIRPTFLVSHEHSSKMQQLANVPICLCSH